MFEMPLLDGGTNIPLSYLGSSDVVMMEHIMAKCLGAFQQMVSILRPKLIVTIGGYVRDRLVIAMQPPRQPP